MNIDSRWVIDFYRHRSEARSRRYAWTDVCTVLPSNLSFDLDRHIESWHCLPKSCLLFAADRPSATVVTSIEWTLTVPWVSFEGIIVGGDYYACLMWNRKEHSFSSVTHFQFVNMKSKLKRLLPENCLHCLLSEETLLGDFKNWTPVMVLDIT